jgi:hypothetical protein
VTRTFSSLLLTLVCLLLVAPAGADEKDDQKRLAAKERFLKGLELVQNERWDAALAEFLASREIFPTKVALKNAAVCYRQLARPVEALEMYEELVSSFCQQSQLDDCALAREAIGKLEREIGQIEVSAQPAGATILIDGKERGSAPLAKPVRVTSGAHTVRVFKEGFVSFEDQVVVAGGQKKSLRATLRQLAKSGRLSVREAQGKKLDVVVDGVVVGQTPWTGTLSVGAHALLLRGPGKLGSPPSVARVVVNQTTTLTLSAVELDASLRVTPVPSNARIDIDGVTVGNGVWEGRLASGRHSVEVTAEGFLAARRELTLTREPSSLRIALDRDLTSPLWKDARPHLYFELGGGLAFGPGFGGDPESDGDHTQPFGFIGTVRAGYAFLGGLGVELGMGYLYLSGDASRAMDATLEGNPVRATDYQDATKLAGPFGELAASYRFFETTPLTLRLAAGVGRFRASFENGGTFPGAGFVSLPEASQRLWVPFVAPEVRFGYRLSKSLSVDLGVAAYLFFPPDVARELPDGGNRAEITSAGLFQLPKERAFGTFVVLVPSIAARLDL